MSSITLTGVDEETPLISIVRLADLGAEIGILYTHSPDGRNRYPSREWVRDTAAELWSVGQVAIHICGKRARAELLGGELDDVIEHATRVQINGLVTGDELALFRRRYPKHDVITQHNAFNEPLLAAQVSDHHILVDASGGRGILPERWLRPVTDKSVGFAGGLGPHTLKDELPKIAAIADGDWWIDMEGKLRDDGDLFDADKATMVMRVWNSCLSKATS